MAEALQRLAEEDPTFQVREDENTGQTLIRGMGELHLEVLIDRMSREFGVGAYVGRPRVDYRETITRKVRSEGDFVRQTGGRNHYAVLTLELEPLPVGGGFKFVNAVSAEAIPARFVAAVEEGVAESLENGVLAGYPLVDVQVTLDGGSFDEEESSEVAFKIAGSIALKSGVQQASPVLLEPVMEVGVVVPEEYTGDVISDLAARDAQIENMERRADNLQVVTTFIPLARMFGYATDLRSVTQGRGSFTMEFDHYAEVPREVMEKIVLGGRR